MSDTNLLAGPALRRLRKREGLTQAGMAGLLGISPSYLNLIERNQRPLSARVLVQVIERFDFDPRSLREDDAIGGLDGLARRMADKRFADLGIDREEVQEFLAAAPQIAAAFARLYDTGGGGERILAEDAAAAARRAVERWQNHFADLDHAAEDLADELRLSRGEISAALSERLREKHQLQVRILPAEVMPGQVHRLDLHARQLQLSEMLPGAARRFQIARQVGMLEMREGIETLVAGANLASPEARDMLREYVADYLAGALLLPYRRFLRACEATGYDLAVLQRRFAVSFDQVAQRLTTLGRVGERGLPFFTATIDRAGRMTHFTAGGSGALYPLESARWPAWVPYAAFERPGTVLTQAVTFGEGEAAARHWFTITRTVDGDGVMCAGRRAVVLGLEARFAGDLAHARGISLDRADAVPLGTPCGRCGRAECLTPAPLRLAGTLPRPRPAS
ncbi:helix-turn-helix domain-containing protein [Porphyrobacter sp. CACIAM 03H1]|uniref:helix-turn-helix domain-containing protein n=1 Tax=Porphyrobacter sp. CACIAM 03H1 TaxID=2003315 RepID=UPI000B5A694D|nr:short-chain fatty acyl-CoA regulator family protein [Porphyrobacter sp. CACIAM 03H1]ASJ91181.1 XRE family transcriptional regulator [Porphyrobacter sp. CACIAM 03H1]